MNCLKRSEAEFLFFQGKKVWTVPDPALITDIYRAISAGVKKSSSKTSFILGFHFRKRIDKPQPNLLCLSTSKIYLQWKTTIYIIVFFSNEAKQISTYQCSENNSLLCCCTSPQVMFPTCLLDTKTTCLKKPCLTQYTAALFGSPVTFQKYSQPSRQHLSLVQISGTDSISDHHLWPSVTQDCSKAVAYAPNFVQSKHVLCWQFWSPDD